MLHKNKIFLKLLGSFYDQTANTDFAGRIDHIYTSILFNRYVEVLHRSIVSLDGDTYPATPHFGYIKASEIDIPSSTISIIDVNKNIVTNADFISFGYLDIEEFFSVDNGVVSSDVIQKASTHTGDVIPIVYIVDEGKTRFASGVFGFVDGMEDFDGGSITNIVMKLISDQIAYFPSTIPTLDKLVNIILGAEYSRATETVLHVDDDIVITDLNSYDLIDENYGRAIVSVGDKVKSSSLITRVAHVRNDIAHIGDIVGLNRYLLSTGVSNSNRNFLRKLSSTVTRNKLAIDIPAELFSMIDRDLISVVSSVFGVSSSKTILTTSSHSDDDSITGSSSFGYILSEETVGEISMAGFWTLDTIADSMNVQANTSESIMFSTEDNIEPMDDFGILMDPVKVEENMVVSENMLALLTEELPVTLEDEDIMDGLFIDTNIATVYESTGVSLKDEMVVDADDVDPFMTKGTVTLDDEMLMQEEDNRSISVADVASMVISDFINTVYNHFEIMDTPDSLAGYSEIIDMSIVDIDDKNSIISADTSIFNPTEEGDMSTAITIVDSSTIAGQETISSSATQLDNSEITVDMGTSSGELLVQIVDTILVNDESDIESINTIDS